MLSKRTVNLVCRNMQHAEVRLGVVRKADPILPRGFQHRERAVDVGLNEIGGTGYGAVNVAFCGQMHHVVRLKCRECFIYRGSIADIGLNKTVVQSVFDWF
ncbi:hypothetical protein D3C80_964020 [compost metagenome]